MAPSPNGKFLAAFFSDTSDMTEVSSTRQVTGGQKRLPWNQSPWKFPTKVCCRGIELQLCELMVGVVVVRQAFQGKLGMSHFSLELISNAGIIAMSAADTSRPYEIGVRI